jgi:Uma2 family endonuclease
MTMQESRLMTVEEFEAFVDLPENANKRFEFIGGEMIEVPNNAYSSEIAIRISSEIYFYLKQNRIGRVTGEGGGFKIGTERYAPDVAFTSFETQEKFDKKGYNSNPPDLAVEVVSSDSKTENDELTVKLSTYLSVGTIVWIVRPEKKIIEVHEAGKIAKIFRENDTIKLESLLPNFELKLSEVFQE